MKTTRKNLAHFLDNIQEVPSLPRMSSGAVSFQALGVCIWMNLTNLKLPKSRPSKKVTMMSISFINAIFANSQHASPPLHAINILQGFYFAAFHETKKLAPKVWFFEHQDEQLGQTVRWGLDYEGNHYTLIKLSWLINTPLIRVWWLLR